MILYHAEILLTLEGQEFCLYSGLKGHRIIVVQANSNHKIDQAIKQQAWDLPNNDNIEIGSEGSEIDVSDAYGDDELSFDAVIGKVMVSPRSYI